jgi:hypothetical protein
MYSYVYKNMSYIYFEGMSCVHCSEHMYVHTVEADMYILYVKHIGLYIVLHYSYSYFSLNLRIFFL